MLMQTVCRELICRLSESVSLSMQTVFMEHNLSFVRGCVFVNVYRMQESYFFICQMSQLFFCVMHIRIENNCQNNPLQGSML